NELKKDINQLIEEAFDSSRFFSSVKDSGENQIDVSEEEDNARVSVELITSETQIISLLDHVRLVIDLGEKPD
ncbi:accessory Sec system glycosyltransferase Asp1, partial [Streptococcus suis]